MSTVWLKCVDGGTGRVGGLVEFSRHHVCWFLGYLGIVPQHLIRVAYNLVGVVWGPFHAAFRVIGTIGPTTEHKAQDIDNEANN